VTGRAPCDLCSPGLGPLLVESPLWRLILNRNQNLLGKCFAVTRRHVENVDELTAEEWDGLRSHIRLATAALRRATQPDHFNYAFLQNQDRHVHLHVIPRFAAPRQLIGLAFSDAEYPGHYAVPGHDRRLTAQQYEQLADIMRQAVRSVVQASA
jgi:diadenosine tetraphosphate (Ap4A) HIT family hydrolase